MGSVPGLERSPGEGKGYPLQYSGLENSMDCIVSWGHKESDMTERLNMDAQLSLKVKAILRVCEKSGGVTVEMIATH